MTPEDSSATNENQVHDGYDLEAGLLARLREWIDVFPWLRLIRILRVVGSPPLLGLIALTLAVWKIGITLLALDQSTPDVPDIAGTANQQVNFFVAFIGHLNPASVFHGDPEIAWWKTLLGIGWSVFVWTPVVILLSRQGGLLTAGRSLMPLSAALSLALSRTLAGWLAAVVPLGCIAVLAVLIMMIGWISGLVVDITWLNSIMAGLTLLFAIPCGLLAFGANVAIPLSWAALANERDPDTMDSLSRGYEYLFRRPLHLAAYLLFSAIIASIIFVLAVGVTRSAIQINSQLLKFSDASDGMVVTSTNLLDHLPVVVLLTAIWSLLGGVYLLLRHDAGGQEVEDLWQADACPEPPLPSIPSQSTDSTS
ncbi:MAG: hypothetical protein CMM01_25825 [Rhodopirellula sp.]|nr:hypothetical protein [Rhodopirellula sp.]OUX49105.1 MAG: hypothetical protein CBE43_10890 [Rhodopirellula sp. TMED283]